LPDSIRYKLVQYIDNVRGKIEKQGSKPTKVQNRRVIILRLNTGFHIVRRRSFPLDPPSVRVAGASIAGVRIAFFVFKWMRSALVPDNGIGPW
jgi:hypothetical protein